MELNTVYNESNLQTMQKMESDFIDCVITSPPYDNLRDYNGYSFDFNQVAKELFRVVKPGGVIVWVVSDATINGSETGTSFKQALYFKEIGFNIHDTMIYKKNGASYPANDKSSRYSQIFEYMFVFSKGKPKTINLIKDKVNKWHGTKTFGKKSNRQVDGTLKKKDVRKTPLYGYRNNIWKINNGFGYSTKDKIAHQHPAIFPEKLVSDHIETWTKLGDLIYDPFMGSGTTAKVAYILNRKYVGSEISLEYCKLIHKRLQLVKKNLFT